ncbi:U-box domain-containing protein 21 [Platanthera zijinensis]|uniref:U-box domain-containing protein n=1 Tax=Platanthera zijinensis TaxID=2320716 RepID=A0AAP0B955_9ASPA
MGLIRSFKLPFLRRRISAVAGGDSSAELSIPHHFRCPISLDLMKDPVTLPTGITYDRTSIETWLDAGNRTCPVTKQPLFILAGNADHLIPNHTLRRMIQEWCVAHRSLGIERIPTPKIPITALQVAETLSEISAACRRGDSHLCSQLAAKLKNWAGESERNRRCISSNGAARVLAAAYHDSPSEQILSAIAGILPLDEEARRQLASPESLSSIVSAMGSANLCARLHAVMVVREIAAANTEESVMIGRTNGLPEALLKLIKEPISPQATKVALVATYYLAAADEITASRFAALGMVPLLLEMLVETERRLCEKALAALDSILGTKAGREMAAGNDLAVPVIVKKMLRVSDAATELAVSGLWKLCRENGSNGLSGGEKCLKEAVQVGAFQKLLVMLQVGCSESTKEKVTELLKMMNGFRGQMECIESVDFRGLKRPF